MKMQMQIDQIMEHFNFHKVHKVMELLNWIWAHDDGIERVPDIKELREGALDLLERVAVSGKKDEVFSSGGFKVQKYGNILILEFVLEDWTGELY